VRARVQLWLRPATYETPMSGAFFRAKKAQIERARHVSLSPVVSPSVLWFGAEPTRGVGCRRRAMTMSLATAPGQTLLLASGRSSGAGLLLFSWRLLQSAAGLASSPAPLSSFARRTTSGSCAAATTLAANARDVGSRKLGKERERGSSKGVCSHVRSTSYSSFPLCVNRAQAQAW